MDASREAPWDAEMGILDGLEYDGGRLNVHGWMLHPHHRIRRFLINIGNLPSVEAEVVERDDIEAAYPRVGHSRYSGFDVSPLIAREQLTELTDVTVLGFGAAEEVARIESCYSVDLAEGFPRPEPRLMERVSGTEHYSYFVASGFRAFRDFWPLIVRHSDLQRVKTFLDWGCGCGRVTHLFKGSLAAAEFHGCDIDAEAVGWCKDHINGIQFRPIPLMPPTEYADGSFDVVTGISIFTHLTKQAQIAWLEEMERIIAPGGLFVASVHGDFAARVNLGAEAGQRLKKGIYDGMLDGNLDDVAPQEYYRTTYQSRAFTTGLFGKYFDILDYLEQRSSRFQDVVVMRRPLRAKQRGSFLTRWMKG